MDEARRGYFKQLRLLSAGEERKISPAMALASARIYRRAWAETDRLLPVPEIEINSEGDILTSWAGEGRPVEVCVSPDDSMYWFNAGRTIWEHTYGFDWDTREKLPDGLRDAIDRIVGREAPRPAPLPPLVAPPRYEPPGLLEDLPGCCAVVIGLSGLVAYHSWRLEFFWPLAICGGITAAAFLVLLIATAAIFLRDRRCRLDRVDGARDGQ